MINHLLKLPFLIIGFCLTTNFHEHFKDQCKSIFSDIICMIFMYYLITQLKMKQTKALILTLLLWFIIKFIKFMV